MRSYNNLQDTRGLPNAAQVIGALCRRKKQSPLNSKSSESNTGLDPRVEFVTSNH